MSDGGVRPWCISYKHAVTNSHEYVLFEACMPIAAQKVSMGSASCLVGYLSFKASVNGNVYKLVCVHG